MLDNSGKKAEAAALLRKALEIDRKALGDAHPYTQNVLNNLAIVLRGLGKDAEAIPLLRQAVEYARKTLGEQKLIRAAFGNNNVDTCARDDERY